MFNNKNVNASKHKFQIRISQKLLSFSKHALCKSFSNLKSFVFEKSTVEIAKVTDNHFWAIFAQIGFFPFLILLENVFRQNLQSKIPLNILKPPVFFE